MLDKPHSPDLTALKGRRAAVGERLVGLHEARARLSQAEDAESAALVAIGALGRDEVRAAREWASSASASAPPAIDGAKRAKLTAALASAQAAAEAARGAAAGIDAEIVSASQEGADLARRIDDAVLTSLGNRHLQEMDTVRAAAVVFREMVAKALAGLEYIRLRGEDHQAHGRIEEARKVYMLVERLSQGLTIDAQPDRSEVNAYVSSWSEIYSELIK